jgi:hypothetical protein
MSLSRIRTLVTTCLLVALVAGSAQAQYLLVPGNDGGSPPTPNNRAGLQIGTGLPLPVGPGGIFLGGKALATAGTPFWPVAGGTMANGLLVQTAPGTAGNINQTLGTAQGGAITLPAGVLSNMIVGSRAPIAVFPTNPAVFQVRTTIDYSWPSAAAVLAPGGAPGIPGTAVSPPPPAAGYSITYSGSTKSFGGAAQMAIAAGPAAGTKLLPPNATAVKPIATVWINSGGKPPALATKALIAGASSPLGVGQPGAPLAAAAGVTAWGPGFFVTGLAVGPAGTINASMVPSPIQPAPSNMVTFSKGYPWTTGLITIAAPAGAAGNPAETFYLSGTDMRVAGVGNVSLVSGALSRRQLSGPNANRGWVSLTIPEPTAALGAAGALGMLGLCHALVRRRSR